MITVITGATAGIGAAAAEEIARAGHDVVLIGRSRARLDSVAARIENLTGRRPDTHAADLASFTEVRTLAGELLDRYERIDVLANNAGVMTPKRETTADGHETMMQVNHLSGFLLTNLLRERLVASGGRVVTTSSRAAKSGRLDPTDLDRKARRWNGWLQYSDTKQANALFTVELARRGVTATCFHPGVIRTGFAAGTLLMKIYGLIPGYFKTPEQGASTLVRLATTSDGADHSGRYFSEQGVPSPVPEKMEDPALAAALWTASLAATGLPAETAV
ncbi:SDR family NAD(P)-dependent oxidoreductase [Sphaerisporangium sp. B11E5]|uniref:SDR family NAD(P)-dependent oxidoreductase n=1 Tax=Sphaerisporangium sp. B11E5 TaxID=3153563 RepID=UPI00325D7DDA